MGYSMQALFAVIAGYMIDETTKNYKRDPFYLVLALMVFGLLISLVLLQYLLQKLAPLRPLRKQMFCNL